MKVKELQDIIASDPFFQGLDKEFCATIAGCGRQMRVDAGQLIYQQGDPADDFYIIRHGHVALEFPGAGKPMIHQTLHDGDVLNAAWVVPPYRCYSDARAVGTTVMIALDAACLRGKCESDHDFGYELMKRFVPVVVERLGHAKLQSLDVYGQGNTA